MNEMHTSFSHVARFFLIQHLFPHTCAGYEKYHTDFKKS